MNYFLIFIVLVVLIGLSIVVIKQKAITPKQTQSDESKLRPGHWEPCVCDGCKGTGKMEPPEFWTKSHPEDAGKLDECSYCNGSGEMCVWVWD